MILDSEIQIDNNNTEAGVETNAQTNAEINAEIPTEATTKTNANKTSKLKNWQRGSFFYRRWKKRILVSIITVEIWLSLKIGILVNGLIEKSRQTIENTAWITKLFVKKGVEKVERSIDVLESVLLITGTVSYVLILCVSFYSIVFIYADYKVTLSEKNKKQWFYKIAITFNIIAYIALELWWKISIEKQEIIDSLKSLIPFF